MTDKERDAYNCLLDAIIKADCGADKQHAINRVELFLKATGLTAPELRNSLPVDVSGLPNDGLRSVDDYDLMRAKNKLLKSTFLVHT